MPKREAAGKKMTSEELERINLECDLMALVSKHAWPQAQKIVEEILKYYRVEPRHEKVPIHIAASGSDAPC
jgi:hypothetical protein